MANECEWTYMSSIALETSGATLNSASFGSGDASSITSSGHGNWPLCDLVLYSNGFAASLAGFQVINVYRRDMDLLGGTADANEPSAVEKNVFVGSFPMIASAGTDSTGYVPLCDVPLSQSCIFYIENSAGQDLQAGWGLWCRPKTNIPGA